MSNTSVGAVYQQIINDVIDASRTDFEDGGVEEGVLEELRKVGSIKPFGCVHILRLLFPSRPPCLANPTSDPIRLHVWRRSSYILIVEAGDDVDFRREQWLGLPTPRGVESGWSGEGAAGRYLGLLTVTPAC